MDIIDRFYQIFQFFPTLEVVITYKLLLFHRSPHWSRRSEGIWSVEDIETSQIYNINKYFHVIKLSVEEPSFVWDTNLLFLL